MSHTIIDDGSGIKVTVLDNSDFKYPSVNIALIKDAINKLSVNNKPIDPSYWAYVPSKPTMCKYNIE